MVKILLVAFLSLSLQASDKDLYDFLWLDQDKKVFVLQNKLYEKKHTFYTDLSYTQFTTGAFQDTSGFKVGAGFYLSEEFSIELVYGQYSNADNESLKQVQSISKVAPFIRRPVSMTSLFVNWAPFYGKINTFNQIFYFDLIAGLGTGVMNMESNVETVDESEEIPIYAEESYTPLHLRLEMRFHATENIHIGAEVMTTFVDAQTPSSKPNTKMQQFNEYSFKVGVSF